ncbi:uncharacterized protein LOC127702227 [Mytilus californianus]|uniref:uncharacterized protein LOC127702227 n=1 Tax=Mytilus californianus TaxID=6549 RepID=UPI0022474923|nr:uncharacterized protein LOC127702227 [Mytilus californianus]
MLLARRLPMQYVGTASSCEGKTKQICRSIFMARNVSNFIQKPLIHLNALKPKCMGWRIEHGQSFSKNMIHFKEGSPGKKRKTIEQELTALMDKWEMKKAVNLFRESVENGVFPDLSIVLNLLQQLGNLGDYECLLSLRELLMDNKLCSIDTFFGCLQEAYYYSGRLDEAVLLLRILYHDLRNYDDVDIFFTLIGVMLLQHFPHRFELIESFAKDCREKEWPDLLPTAGLWKCFVLTENFEKAEQLLTTHSGIKQNIAQMANHIVEKKNKVEVDRLSVLNYLKESSIITKENLRISIYLHLLRDLVHERKWSAVLDCLKEAKERQMVLPVDEVKMIRAKAEQVLFNDDFDNFTLMQCIDKLKKYNYSIKSGKKKPDKY